MDKVTSAIKFADAYELDQDIFRKMLAHYVRLGTYRAAEAHLGLVIGSFEEYLCDHPDMGDKVNAELMAVGTGMACRAIPSAVGALVSVIQSGSDDTKHTLQAIANLTQIVTKFNSKDGDGGGGSDDIDDLYKRLGGKK